MLDSSMFFESIQTQAVPVTNPDGNTTVDGELEEQSGRSKKNVDGDHERTNEIGTHLAPHQHRPQLFSSNSSPMTQTNRGEPASEPENGDRLTRLTPSPLLDDHQNWKLMLLVMTILLMSVLERSLPVD